MVTIIKPTNLPPDTLEQIAEMISQAAGQPVQFKPLTLEKYIESRVAAGEPETAASYIWEFIDSIRAR